MDIELLNFDGYPNVVSALLDPHSATKVLIDAEADAIVGAHLLGPDCGEITAVFALAINAGLTTRQLKQMTPVYPTVASHIGSML